MQEDDMGLFDGARDGLYEDEEVFLDAGKHGYLLTDREWRKLYGPLKEDEMLDLIDGLDFDKQKRRRLTQAVKEHAETYHRYRSERKAKQKDKRKTVKEEPELVEEEKPTRNIGCGCLVVLIIGIWAFSYFMDNFM